MTNMTLKIWLTITVLVILVSSQTFSQNRYKDINFAAPMKIPLVLAGNFAELRSNHFHTGLDIKTNNREGYKLYAIEDGYIARINVSHWGYGLCIYVQHPNGFTSVYAHCKKFTPEVEAFVRKAQRKKEKETITLYPGAEQFPVKRGEVIGFSGNSGSSVAPHLHFEIRDTKTEEPINPLLFGFDVKDDIPPIIKGIKIYSLNGANVNGKNADLLCAAIKNSQGYHIKTKSPIVIHGEVGIAINTIDKLNEAPNKCGIYSIELYDGDTLIFQQKFEKLNFYTNRYINTYMDYLQYRYRKESYHKSFLAVNNKLEIYGEIRNKGILKFEKNEVKKMKYIVSDVYGNKSELYFDLKGETSLKKRSPINPNPIQFNASKKNELVRKEFKAYLPQGALYDDASIQFQEYPARHNTISAVFNFNTDSVPIHKYYILKLKLSGVKPAHQNKLVIAELSKNMNRLSSKGGTMKDGWVTSKVRSFGNYAIAIDTVKPKITPLNLENKKYKIAREIRFKISDNLSGIDTYNVKIDGNWFHAFYNPKTNLLRVPFNQYNKIDSGKHKLVTTITDERKNTAVFKANIEL